MSFLIRRNEADILTFGARDVSKAENLVKRLVWLSIRLAEVFEKADREIAGLHRPVKEGHRIYEEFRSLKSKIDEA